MCTKVHSVHSMVHTYTHSEGSRESQGDCCCINTINVSSGDKRLWWVHKKKKKNPLQCIVQNLKWGENMFPLSAVGNPFVFGHFALQPHCIYTHKYMYKYMLLPFSFECACLCSSRIVSEMWKQWRGRREGVNWLQSGELAPLHILWWNWRVEILPLVVSRNEICTTEVQQKCWSFGALWRSILFH